ncbi:phosphoribosylanthranilate isomerase [Frigoribacterium sp. 2-23]|uniref:phosphoribosylanthranilate isomerase n=1 Tax=Frigoribacterium sp. 2-23 TaxID=3415006 RepID=UPI003C6FF2D6
MWVKICGLATDVDVDTAVEAGADAIGFVFAPGSPREVSVDTARRLAERVPEGVETVGVFRGQPIGTVLAVARASGVGTIQLHGDEPPADAEAARAAGLRVIRALAADTWLSEDEEARGAFGDHRLLLDAPDPGAGATFDATGLVGAAPAGDWILAGGLRPDNVARLVAALGPTGVDVSSGVEESRGRKSPALIREFVAAARAV